jgi:hypothetical protein
MNLIDTPNIFESAITSGEDQHHYRQNSSGAQAGQGPSVPSAWHGSNRTWDRELRYAGGASEGEVSCTIVNGHRYFPLLRSGLGVELRHWKDCFL